MPGTALDTLLGAVVVVIAAAFLTFAFAQSDLGAVKGYQLVAKFERADGISVGTDVRIGGIKVGTVTKQNLDPVSYLAVLHLSIASSVKLPTDSLTQVSTEGLLGGKYLAIVPGVEEKMLQPGEEIRYTQSAVSLEELLGKFALGGAGGAPK